MIRLKFTKLILIMNLTAIALNCTGTEACVYSVVLIYILNYHTDYFGKRDTQPNHVSVAYCGVRSRVKMRLEEIFNPVL